MSELDDTPEAGKSSPGPGALLRNAREARGATIAEVATALKMSARQIQAIEEEEFSQLSGATFVRGFIRNYARLLQIDAAPILAALPEQAAAATAQLRVPSEVRVKMPALNRRQGKGLPIATFFALIVLGISLLLYFDVFDLSGSIKPWVRAASQHASTPERPVTAQPAPLVTHPASMPQSESVPQRAGEEDASQRVAGTEAPQNMPVPPGMGRLVFVFDANSWVDVKDAGGRTIFSQMNAKGTTQVVDGKPPLQLVVGNASQVKVRYNDEPVDLGPHTRVDVARFTLE